MLGFMLVKRKEKCNFKLIETKSKEIHAISLRSASMHDAQFAAIID